MSPDRGAAPGIEMLNTPPMGPPPGPGGRAPDPMLDPLGMLQQHTQAPQGPTLEDVKRAAGPSDGPPKYEAPDAEGFEVALPAGWFNHAGELVKTARVRELNGYDEERLARIDAVAKSAAWITELIADCVEDIGGQHADKNIARQLLIGDRDALVFGIRRATYGNEVGFTIDCSACGAQSEAAVLLDEDIPVKELEEPHKREYEIELKRGNATVVLLNGAAQEAFGDNIDRKTPAEINTIMLSKAVIAINGQPTMGSSEAVRKLSSADRNTITEFITENQPGPRTRDIKVACHACGEQYPALMGLQSLFRL